MASQPTLLKRVEALEEQVNELAQLTANHVARMPTLLVGWAEISAYCRKRPRTLSRYAKGLAFPAFRFGRHVVSSPFAIDDWLAALARARKRRMEGPVSGLSDGELQARLKELDETLKHELAP